MLLFLLVLSHWWIMCCGLLHLEAGCIVLDTPKLATCNQAYWNHPRSRLCKAELVLTRQ